MRFLRRAVALEHEPLHHMRDDVALETVVRTLSEGRVRSDRAREIFVGNRVHPVRHMRLKRFAGFDLVARDADFHFSSPSWPVRRQWERRYTVSSHSGWFSPAPNSAW